MKNLFALILIISCNFSQSHAQIKQLQYKLKKASTADLSENGKCMACLTNIKSMPIEIRWNLITKNNTIYFYISDHNYLNKLFPESLDGLAIDLVTRSQYTCGKRSKEPILPAINKGTLLEPVYYDEFKNRIKKDENDGSATFKI